MGKIVFGSNFNFLLFLSFIPIGIYRIGIIYILVINYMQDNSVKVMQCYIFQADVEKVLTKLETELKIEIPEFEGFGYGNYLNRNDKNHLIERVYMFYNTLDSNIIKNLVIEKLTNTLKTYPRKYQITDIHEIETDLHLIPADARYNVTGVMSFVIEKLGMERIKLTKAQVDEAYIKFATELSASKEQLLNKLVESLPNAKFKIVDNSTRNIAVDEYENVRDRTYKLFGYCAFQSMFELSCEVEPNTEFSRKIIDPITSEVTYKIHDTEFCFGVNEIYKKFKPEGGRYENIYTLYFLHNVSAVSYFI